MATAEYFEAMMATVADRRARGDVEVVPYARQSGTPCEDRAAHPAKGCGGAVMAWLRKEDATEQEVPPPWDTAAMPTTRRGT